MAEKLVSADNLVQEFRQVAKEYVELIENCGSIPRLKFVKRAHTLLADLYRMGALLPDVTLDTNDLGREPISHEQWAKVYRQISDKLADVNVYWGVFDPADPDDSHAIQGELSDDLADIYRDLRNALPIDDSVPFAPNDLWTLRHEFENHWGHHVVSALTAFHSLLYGPSYLTDE